ncbi:MAG: HAD family hydrolase, partial [Candidatus Pacebacteria bacterium]|nr:HAD family hydrolase [Candidatus Paceibacterota bacterium]
MTSFKLLASDLDGTLLGKPDATLAFGHAWREIPAKVRPKLCYLTGRIIGDALDTVKYSDLPAPDYLITGSGTCVYNRRKKTVVKAFSEIFEETWDRRRIETVLSTNPRIRKRRPHHQGRYKSSWCLEDAAEQEIDGLRECLEREGLDVVVHYYPEDSALDVLPPHADKAN